MDPAEAREIENLVGIWLAESDVSIRERGIGSGGDQISGLLRTEDETMGLDARDETRLGRFGDIGVAPDGEHGGKDNGCEADAV